MGGAAWNIIGVAVPSWIIARIYQEANSSQQRDRPGFFLSLSFFLKKGMGRHKRELILTQGG